MLNKYKYAIILTLLFITFTTIFYYKNNSEILDLQLQKSISDNQLLLDKIKEQEKSITEYKESVKRQADKLKELNDKSISYESDIESLKKEVKKYNIKESIKTKPEETKFFINDKINNQFNEISELTLWKIL